jgi:hypothetical protein
MSTRAREHAEALGLERLGDPLERLVVATAQLPRDADVHAP